MALSRDCWRVVTQHLDWPEVWALSQVCRASWKACTVGELYPKPPKAGSVLCIARRQLLHDLCRHFTHGSETNGTMMWTGKRGGKTVYFLHAGPYANGRMRLDLLRVVRHMLLSFSVEKSFFKSASRNMVAEVVSFIEVWGKDMFRFSYIDAECNKWSDKCRVLEDTPIKSAF